MLKLGNRILLAWAGRRFGCAEWAQTHSLCGHVPGRGDHSTEVIHAVPRYLLPAEHLPGEEGLPEAHPLAVEGEGAPPGHTAHSRSGRPPRVGALVRLSFGCLSDWLHRFRDSY
eukprot:gene9303-biopygen4189